MPRLFVIDGSTALANAIRRSLAAHADGALPGFTRHPRPPNRRQSHCTPVCAAQLHQAWDPDDADKTKKLMPKPQCAQVTCKSNTPLSREVTMRFRDHVRIPTRRNSAIDGVAD
jgi:hypothetical protein